MWDGVGDTDKDQDNPEAVLAGHRLWAELAEHAKDSQYFIAKNAGA